MAVGIKEIAHSLGLSYNTVSNILNRGMESLYRPETRALVQKAAADLDYQPNRGARAMRSQKSRVIGFAAQSQGQNGALENYTIYPFLVGLNRGLTSADYHVTLVELREISAHGETGIPNILRERFFDGLIVHYGAPQDLAAWSDSLKIPVLWWDSGKPEKTGHLYRDEGAVGAELTRRLIGLGHTSILFMTGESGWEKYQRGEEMHFSFGERYQSYAREMTAAGLKEEALVGYEVGELAAQLKNQNATAVVVNGEIPVPLLMAAQKLGLEIPGDLTIASLDVEARIVKSGHHLGGITYDRVEAGEMAAKRILSALSSPNPEIPSHSYTGNYQTGHTISSPRKKP